MKNKKDLDYVQNRIERNKTALELSKELFMLTGNINYYNLYKSLKNPKSRD